MFKIIGFFFKSSWKVIVMAAIGSGAAAGLILLGLKLLGDIVKNVEADPVLTYLYATLAILVSSIVTHVVGYGVTKHYEYRVASYRKEMSEKLLNARYEKFQSKLYRIVPILLFEISAVGGFGRGIPAVLVSFFQSVVIIGYLFTLSWQLTLILFPLFFLVSIVNVLTLPIFKTIEKRMSEVRFMLHFSLERMEKGFKDLLINKEHAKTHVDDSIAGHSNEVARLGLKTFNLKSIIDKSVGAFMLVGFGAILLLSITQFNFDQALLVEYLALVLYVRPSLNKVANFFKQVKSVENALEQVESFDVDIKKSGTIADGTVEYQPDLQKVPLISLENVSFEYPVENPFRLENISLEVKQNEILIIKGYNGSGKTTLFNLIVGLYTPNSGAICFQGNSISKDNLKAYRSYFSCHFTDSPLFDNFNYLDLGNRDELNSIMNDLQLSSKTELDERNVLTKTDLSNGQKGRISLLRLLLENKRIYFFDEWAANQDIYFKEKFYTEIVPGLKAAGKTVILISHDDKFYNIADRIITIKNGKLENVSVGHA